MEFRMLGDLEVSDEGKDVPVRGAKLRVILLLLLVRARETVRAERIADELWGDDQPAGGANTLQAQVSKLRRALGDGGSLLVTSGGGYRIDVPDDAIDARRFSDEADRGRAALVAGEVAEAAEVLRDALALWRGPALDGSDDEGLLRREAQRLEELRWAVLEDRIDADLLCGRHGELVPELEHLVTGAPLRERLHGFLMLALYRSGRQAEALRAFQAARDVLSEELGLDPGPELRALETAILTQDPSLDPEPTAPRADPRRRTNVTASLSSFVGRADDLDALRALVDDQRLVTVVGPGGAGKTRLAHEVGLLRRGTEDVWLVELAALGDPVAVTDAVVSALAVPDAQTLIGGGPAQGSALDRIADHIGDRPTLLLLDNCEHLIAEAARVAEVLLRTCPGLRILATSREALGIGGEALWPVPPMAPDDAAALFLARAASSGIEPDGESAAAVGELCTRLDGLPLAIELAAARSRAIPIPQLTARLDDRFRILKGGARTALPRQQTLRAVVEWSYDLLFEDEQEVFDRLAVFAGGCSLDAAEAVCADAQIPREDVADILLRLVDKSLVIADRTGEEVRFHLLQTLTLFGRERLGAREHAVKVWARHAAHFRRLCSRGMDAFRGDRQADWLAEVRREAENIRSALAWLIDQGDAEGALEVAGGIAWTFWLTGGGAEGVRLLESALACPGDAPVSLRAEVTMWTSAVMSNAGTGLERAIELGERSLDLWTEAGDDAGLGEAAALAGGVHVIGGHRERALELFDRSAALFAGRPGPWAEAIAASSAGRAATIRGDLIEAERLQRLCVERFEAAGALWASASINSDIALLAEMRGQLQPAMDATEKALEAARHLGLGLAEAQLLARLGNLTMADGQIDRAEALHDDALMRAEEMGAPMSVAYALGSRAMARRRRGDLAEARAAAEHALALWHSMEVPTHVALSLATLGFVAEREGDLDDARQRHEEVVALGRTGDGRALALGLDGLAGVASAAGDAQRAAQLLGRASQVRIEAGGVLAQPWSDAPRIELAARAALGDEGFDAAYAGGATATMDELLDA